MTLDEAIEVINNGTKNISTDQESMEAFKVYFKSFGVDLQDEKGKYKSIYDILKEAHKFVWQKGGTFWRIVL